MRHIQNVGLGNMARGQCTSCRDLV